MVGVRYLRVALVNWPGDAQGWVKQIDVGVAGSGFWRPVIVYEVGVDRAIVERLIGIRHTARDENGFVDANLEALDGAETGALAKVHPSTEDAPPVLPVTDAGLLTAVADGALLVVRLGKTYKDQVELAVNNLERVNGHLLGSVLNGATKKNMGEALYG